VHVFIRRKIGIYRYSDTDRRRYAVVRHANQSSRPPPHSIVVLFVRVKQINVDGRKKESLFEVCRVQIAAVRYTFTIHSKKLKHVGRYFSPNGTHARTFTKCYTNTHYTTLNSHSSKFVGVQCSYTYFFFSVVP